MTIAQIKDMQTKIGAFPDGEWGPKSKAACIKYLRTLCLDNPWPKDSIAELNKFFGNYDPTNGPKRKAWLKANIIDLDVKRFGFQYLGKPVNTIQCHRLVADSLTAIFAELQDLGFGNLFETYFGCLNIRDSRSKKGPSRHSWGSAIDFMATSNAYAAPWPDKGDMPFEIICVFAKHGWMSGGVVWGKDAMHFQATKF